MKLTTARRSTIAQGILADMAAGTTVANPLLHIYNGTIPANMGGAIGDTLLATLTLTATVGTQANGVITFDAITEDSAADATGTAGWARVVDRDSAEAAYFTITGTGGGGDIELNVVELTAGGPVAITSGTITVGGA